MAKYSVQWSMNEKYAFCEVMRVFALLANRFFVAKILILSWSTVNSEIDAKFVLKVQDMYNFHLWPVLCQAAPGRSARIMSIFM